MRQTRPLRDIEKSVTAFARDLLADRAAPVAVLGAAVRAARRACARSSRSSRRRRRAPFRSTRLVVLTLITRAPAFDAVEDDLQRSEGPGLGALDDRVRIGRLESGARSSSSRTRAGSMPSWTPRIDRWTITGPAVLCHAVVGAACATWPASARARNDRDEREYEPPRHRSRSCTVPRPNALAVAMEGAGFEPA